MLQSTMTNRTYQEVLQAVRELEAAHRSVFFPSFCCFLHLIISHMGRGAEFVC